MKVIKRTSIVSLCASLVLVAASLNSQPARASEPFVAEIIMFGGNFAPRGWALTDGQLLPISQNQALFSILGTTFGGDGRTSFGLPDLRGRVPMHAGTGPGLATRRLGQKGGAQSATLGIANLPSHNHPGSAVTSALQATSASSNTGDPDGNALANTGNSRVYNNSAPNVSMHAASITNTTTIAAQGGGQSFSIEQPYQVVNFIIALVGVFPSRN